MSASSGSEDVHCNGRQGHKYLGLLDVTTKELRVKVQEYQQILNEDLSSERGDQTDGSPLSEEVKGKIRSAIGKATLLVDKKFTQFQGLCHKNLNEDEADTFRTLDDDLAGFWDLVNIQITDVRDLFSEIDELKRNNWNLPDETPKNQVPEIIKAAERNAVESATNSFSTKVAPKNTIKTKDDEERRKRLREAKKKAAAQLKSATQNDTSDESISIFISNKPEVPSNGNGS